MTISPFPQFRGNVRSDPLVGSTTFVRSVRVADLQEQR